MVYHGRGWCRDCFMKLNETFDIPTGERLSKYGLSLNTFARMFVAQGGTCRICHSDPPLVIDHDHDTGKVRGLLCGRCNSGLGFFRDDPLLLREAIRYLTPKATAAHSAAAARRIRQKTSA